MITKNASRVLSAFANMAGTTATQKDNVVKDLPLPTIQTAEQETSETVKKRVAAIMKQNPGMTYEAAYSLYMNTHKDAKQ